jgi:hypothetical protein
MNCLVSIAEQSPQRFLPMRLLLGWVMAKLLKEMLLKWEPQGQENLYLILGLALKAKRVESLTSKKSFEHNVDQVFEIILRSNI